MIIISPLLFRPLAPFQRKMCVCEHGVSGCIDIRNTYQQAIGSVSHRGYRSQSEVHFPNRELNQVRLLLSALAAGPITDVHTRPHVDAARGGDGYNKYNNS